MRTVYKAEIFYAEMWKWNIVNVSWTVDAGSLRSKAWATRIR
jgi:hypothetical protein